MSLWVGMLLRVLCHANVNLIPCGGMYENSNNFEFRRIFKMQSYLRLLSEEKNDVDKKYTSLLGNIKNFMDSTEKRVLEQKKWKK
jgi:hypothetical protein